jgi:hypothetical protein
MSYQKETTMKTSYVLAGVLAAPLCFSTAIAAEGDSNSFHAMSKLSKGAQVALTEARLADIVGGRGQPVSYRFNRTPGGGVSASASVHPDRVHVNPTVDRALR